MKQTGFLLLFIALACSSPSLAQTDHRENQLTGIFHAEKGKTLTYLQIDGVGRFPKIDLAGTSLKDIPDGSRIWVKGQIKSWLQGTNINQTDMQQPTQWVIVMLVDECKLIKSPFEIPEKK